MTALVEMNKQLKLFMKKYKCPKAFTLLPFTRKLELWLTTWQVFWLGSVEYLPVRRGIQWYEDSTGNGNNNLRYHYIPYSYGDSAGLSPASLLIPPGIFRVMREPNLAANV